MHKTKYIQQIIEQLNKMSEEQKNQWILSQAKLCKESQRQGLLQSLTGEKIFVFPVLSFGRRPAS